MSEMTPRQIVAELDRYIVGQADAKRAVAIAVRNRWRRQRVSEDLRDEIGPKNMMMIGPTGVGKTEIARRLATLSGAPFIKVEATKYTEVGYYGRDVESMVRDLVENAIGMVRAEERARIEQTARGNVEEKLVKLISEALLAKNASAPKKQPAGPRPRTASPFYISPEIAEQVEKNPNFPLPGFAQFVKSFELPGGDAAPEGTDPGAAARPAAEESNLSAEEPEEVPDLDEIRRRLQAGEYEELLVPVTTEKKMPPMVVGGLGMESMENDLQGMLENILPKRSARRDFPVSEARGILFEQEIDHLLDREKINAEAIRRAENLGIIFIDEIDKIVSSERQNGADVSRQGVQRDLLPIVEGTTIQTKYGFVSTEHILFIAAGAFHKTRPNDLMPELQGRFPIRVELTDLSEEDLARILVEPHGALTKQYIAMMKTEGVDLVFEEDAIRELARYAHEVNQSSQNIGARRLATVMERLLEELSFEAPDMKQGRVEMNASYVTQRLKKVADDEELSKFIL
ncbi:MAG: ATP-dependent protease ATPase subunit HslU [Thermoguttaceae bacterium]|nr:ATP-dependent protease ATPase subunit HslU [Thermoguttaceae bacterium]